ncbi:alpha/beta fold hydrolase [Nocardia seriolae]|uniref:alpha/beta fold hydrolase n=1 Tax=Nocardia seriolae TaxID=37332 RepID=UPI002E0F5487
MSGASFPFLLPCRKGDLPWRPQASARCPDPQAHGGNARDAFHVIVPTLPGFGFSGPAVGWTAERVARVWAVLMVRLGYDRYGAHGGDLGSRVTRHLAGLAIEHLTGIHLTSILSALIDPATAAPEDAVDRDAMLTNIMIYWLNSTAGSAARYYFEDGFTWGQPGPRIEIPVAVAQFPHDISVTVRRIAERTHNIVRWTEFDHGGHFPGLEQPDLLVEDLRDFYRHVRH